MNVGPVSAMQRHDTEGDLERAKESAIQCHRRTVTAAGAAPWGSGAKPGSDIEGPVPLGRNRSRRSWRMVAGAKQSSLPASAMPRSSVTPR